MAVPLRFSPSQLLRRTGQLRGPLALKWLNEGIGKMEFVFIGYVYDLAKLELGPHDRVSVQVLVPSNRNGAEHV